MTHPRLRRLFAASVAAAVLVVSGCAVPGQEGAPGVAAVYDGRTITNEYVNEVYQAWATDTEGAAIPVQRRSIITIEVMAPQLIAEADDLGYPVSDAEAENYARQWIRFAGMGGEPSPELIETVRGIFALGVLAFVGVDNDFESLRRIAQEVEENAVFSPRAGKFSAGLFMESVAGATDSALSQELGPFFYTSFINVNGLVEEPAPWIDRG